MKKRLILSQIVLLMISFSCFTQEITGKEIIKDMVNRHEKQMKDVDDYTVISDNQTTYHKRSNVGGKTIYKTRNETEQMGNKLVTIYDGEYFWSVIPSGEVKKEKSTYNPYQIWKNLENTEAEYISTEKLDGHSVYVLKIDEMSNLIGDMSKSIQTNADDKISGKLWIDVKDLVIKKMEMTGKKNMVIKLEDFHNVDGMLIPYRTATTMGGIKKEVDSEDMQKAMKNLEKMKEELAQMPPEQREMVEKSMKSQMEMLEKMTDSSSDEMKYISEVKKVEVNTDLSDELFDGSKLGK